MCKSSFGSKLRFVTTICLDVKSFMTGQLCFSYQAKSSKLLLLRDDYVLSISRLFKCEFYRIYIDSNQWHDGTRHGNLSLVGDGVGNKHAHEWPYQSKVDGPLTPWKKPGADQIVLWLLQCCSFVATMSALGDLPGLVKFVAANFKNLWLGAVVLQVWVFDHVFRMCMFFAYYESMKNPPINYTCRNSKKFWLQLWKQLSIHSNIYMYAICTFWVPIFIQHWQITQLLSQEREKGPDCLVLQYQKK